MLDDRLSSCVDNFENAVLCLGSRSKTDEQKLHSLEAEVLELRTVLKEVKHRNLLLEEQLQQAQYVFGHTMAVACHFQLFNSKRDVDTCRSCIQMLYNDLQIVLMLKLKDREVKVTGSHKGLLQNVHNCQVTSSKII